jgi:glycosyltransferase involved in cell wall biosynthesis
MVKVSVIIPTFQSGKFLATAIDSVISQTFFDYEIIIVDGGSTDNTLIIAKSYGEKVTVVFQDGRGVSNARNIGIKASHGYLIAFLDSDDIWLPNKLLVQTQFLEKEDASCALIYSDASFFKDQITLGNSFEEYPPHRGNIARNLVRSNFIPNSTILVRKSSLKEVGFFDESLHLCEDIDMWLRISEKFTVDYQNDVLAKIRRHEGSITQSFDRHLESLMCFQKKIIPYLLNNSNHNEFYQRYYSPYLSLGLKWLTISNNSKKARARFKQYIALYPYNPRAYLLVLIAIPPNLILIFRKIMGVLPKRLKNILIRKIG